MLEQARTMERLNDFLERRGLLGKYVAAQTGIAESQFYMFKGGHRLLTKTQIQRLEAFMTDYDRRMDANSEGGKQYETRN